MSAPHLDKERIAPRGPDGQDMTEHANGDPGGPEL